MKKYIPKFYKKTDNRMCLRLIRLIFQGLMAVFALIMLINSDSLGWFSHITEVSGNNMRVNLEFIDLDAEFWVYRYDIFNSKVITGREITDIHVQPHDLIFTRRNRYTPLVVRAKVSGDSLKNNQLIHFDISRDTETAPLQPGPASQLPVYSSHILRFTGAIGDALGSSNPSEEMQGLEIYNHLDKALYDTVLKYEGNKSIAQTQDSSNPKCVVGSSNVFVTPKASHTDVQIPYNPETDLKTNGDGKPCLEVYLYISYDEALIQGLRKSPDTAAKEDNYTLKMINDLDYVTISATPDVK